MRRALSLSTLAALWLALPACAPPKNYTPVERVPQLASLEEVMDVQATSADPQFSKREQASFSPAELTSLGETARKIEATSARTKAFSKGPGFDALADRLGTTATTLGKAAASGDAPAIREALVAMKATCKECHSKYR